jgi:hypothetical protein
MQTLLRSAAALAVVATAAGCGSDGPARAVVTGKVTYQGKPVTDGMIRFQIAGRPSAMGKISDGTYLIDHHGGVPVGSGKVEIEGFEETGKVVYVGANGMTQKEGKQVLPPKYNTKSELTVEVPAGGGVVRKDFDLAP